MAPKRSSPLDEPPAASSSEEEETSSGEEEEGVSRDGSSSDEEEDEEEIVALTQAMIPKKSSAPPSTPAVEKKPAPKKSELATNSQAQSSSSESGSGSDSDTDTESGRNVKPIASKPMDETPKVKKPRSKPSTSATPARSSLKRPSDTARDAKRVKKSSEVDDGAVAEDDSKKSVDESKKLFQRLWSEDDEIAILDGMIDYSAKKNMDPALDMNAFHDFIKKSLHVDVTKAQLMDKIRRLKKKYRNNADRGKKGADPTFSKPHEQKGFELSKKIWGGEGICRTPAVELLKSNANGTPKKNQRGSTSKSLALLKAELLSSPDAPKEDVKMKVDDSEAPSVCMDGFVAFERSLGAVGLPESFLKPGLELIGQSKQTELEEEWKKLHVAELELFLKRTELIRDQAKLILEAYKSSDK